MVHNNQKSGLTIRYGTHTVYGITSTCEYSYIPKRDALEYFSFSFSWDLNIKRNYQSWHVSKFLRISPRFSSWIPFWLGASAHDGHVRRCPRFLSPICGHLRWTWYCGQVRRCVRSVRRVSAGVSAGVRSIMSVVNVHGFLAFCGHRRTCLC